MYFKKKPVVIEAIQWTGDNYMELMAWAGNHISPNGSCLNIHTLEGMMTASKGDWIIRGVQGEFYSCRQDIFEATYEEIKKHKPVDNVCDHCGQFWTACRC